MPMLIVFDPDDQSKVATAAAEVFTTIESSLPSIPWLSHSGQQDAYEQTVKLITDATNDLNTDKAARKAIIFWTLTILYANNKKFRVATASESSSSMYGISPASTFPVWINSGSDANPRDIVVSEMSSWTSFTNTQWD